MNAPKLILALAIVSLSGFEVDAQCSSSVALGSSPNILTIIRNEANCIAADKDLNTVVFIHRNNNNTFGGNSGHLRYDISTNAGSTWTNNIGVLNPINSSSARYPNIAIYNPTNNTNPANAYVTFLASTVNNSILNGLVTGVQQVNGTGSTENYNQPNSPSYYISGSVVRGAPGVFWALDFRSNGSVSNGNIQVYKGTCANSNINWTLNTTFFPSLPNPSILGDVNIAFDPSGRYGWVSGLASLNGGPTPGAMSPFFYKTDNYGASWSGPIVVDLGQLTCITGNLNNPPGCFFEADLVVDVYGNPHMSCVVGNSDNNYSIVWNSWHHLFDITQKNGVWTAYDISNIKASPEMFSGSQNVTVYQNISPQAARTSDGKKVFFSWTDNDIYSLGDPNTWPDFFARGLDVVQNKWTQRRDFSSCSPSTSWQVYFPHMAEQVL